MVANNVFVKNNEVQLIKGAEYFSKLKEIIQQANQEIYFHTYIFSNDYTGTLVGDYLIAAANKGVKIFLLIDGIVSHGLSKETCDKFKAAKIEMVFYEPLLHSKHRYFGRRMHQKVIVVDQCVAIIGGMNIADRYNNRPHQMAWLDFAVCIKGEVIKDIVSYCRGVWNHEKQAQSSFQTIEKENHKSKSKDCLARIRINDWVWHRNDVSNSYLYLLKSAEKEVIILCSYFIPGRAIRRQLMRTAKKGIKIKVVMAGKSDVPVAKYAERWLYDWLLRNNIELFEYQTNILHGKLAIADDKLVTIGSYNINDISTYASIEMNIDIKNDAFARKVKEEIQQIIKTECIQITKELHKYRKNIFRQLARWFSYQFIRIVFLSCTFYFKRKA